MKKPVVMYHSLKTIPFDILDLCVFNSNGRASVVINQLEAFNEELEAYTNNYRIRFGEVLETTKAIKINKEKLASYYNKIYGERHGSQPCLFPHRCQSC